MWRQKRRGVQQQSSESKSGAEKNRTHRFQIVMFSRIDVHTPTDNREQHGYVQKVYAIFKYRSML